MTNKKWDKLDDGETNKFYSKGGEKYTCPDCGELLARGPSGGLSINYYCYYCGSKFNETPFHVERINNACNAPDDIANFAAKQDLDKLKFTIKKFIEIAEKEEVECSIRGDEKGSNEALGRLNFWVNFAMRKYGIPV